MARIHISGTRLIERLLAATMRTPQILIGRMQVESFIVCYLVLGEEEAHIFG